MGCGERVFYFWINLLFFSYFHSFFYGKHVTPPSTDLLVIFQNYVLASFLNQETILSAPLPSPIMESGIENRLIILCSFWAEYLLVSRTANFTSLSLLKFSGFLSVVRLPWQNLSWSTAHTVFFRVYLCSRRALFFKSCSINPFM